MTHEKQLAFIEDLPVDRLANELALRLMRRPGQIDAGPQTAQRFMPVVAIGQLVNVAATA